MLPLSVLDLSPVTTATTGSQAIRNTLDLARHVEGLGYRRYWVAEHHNIASIASGAPEVMIGAIAAATSTIRVGSGGVMLPNHAPLMVAERFKVLEALHPGRIDLGLGRAPGTDRLTMMALRRRQEQSGQDDFLDGFYELLAWKTGRFPEGHPFSRIRVVPEDVEVPPIWLLGSSGYSARLAAETGLGFGFAHHFAQHAAEDAMHAYRRGFQPSIFLEKPHAILAVAVMCAETEAQAERLAATFDYNTYCRNRGQFRPLASPEDALAHRYSAGEEQERLEARQRLFVGTPDRVRERLGAFASAMQADELMVTSAIFDHEARKRSFALLAEAFR